MVILLYSYTVCRILVKSSLALKFLSLYLDFIAFANDQNFNSCTISINNMTKILSV